MQNIYVSRRALEEMAKDSDFFKIYTDGSKIDEKVGYRLFSDTFIQEKENYKRFFLRKLFRMFFQRFLNGFFVVLHVF
jgi:hypothetical protein